MANSKFKATAELFLDTSNAKNDAKKFVTDLKQQLNSIETAADKMNVFKELVGYIGQVDNALTALRTKNGDAFKHMFDGVDENFRKQFEDLFELSGDNLQRLDVLREKLATLTPKSGIAEIRKFATELNKLFTSIGADAPLNIDEFKNKATQGQIDNITSALGNFEGKWVEMISRLKDGFSLGPGGVGEAVQRTTESIQAEFDTLESKMNELGEIQKKFIKSIKDMRKYNETGNIFPSDTKFTFEEAKDAIKEFLKVKKEVEDFKGNKKSIEYFEILSKYMQQSVKIASMYNNITGDKTTAIYKQMQQKKISRNNGEQETYISLLGRMSKFARSTLDSSMFDSLINYSDSIDDQIAQICARMKLLEDELEKIKPITENAGSGIAKIGSHVVNTTEYIRGMTIAMKEMFDVLSKTSDTEYKVLIGGQDISIKRGQYKEISGKTTAEAYLANIMQDTDVDAHSHMGITSNINAPDFLQAIKRYYSGMAKISAVIGRDDIVTLDLAKVKAEDAYVALEKLKELTSNKGNESINIEDFNKMMQEINPEYTDVAQKWIPSQFGDLAKKIFDIKQNVQQAISPVEKFKNILISMSGNDIDFSKYNDLLETLSVDNVGDIFNQIAKAEGIMEDGKFLQVEDISAGNIQSVIADIQQQKDAYASLRETAGVTYDEIAKAAKEYYQIFNKSEGQDFEFFKKYFHPSEIAEIQQKFMDVGDGLRDLDGLTRELAMNFGIDFDDMPVTAFQRIGDTAQEVSNQLKVFFDLVDEIRHKSFDVADNADDNLEIGEYIERLNSAKAILDEFGNQNQLTAEQMNQVNDAFNTANTFLTNSAVHYNGSVGGRYDYSYYEEYSDALKENDELRRCNTELESRLNNVSNSTDDSIINNSVQTEVAQLNTLLEKINEVKTAIDAKTNAFREEAGVVDLSIKQEVTSLENLKTYLESLQNIIQNLFNAPTKKLGLHYGNLDYYARTGQKSETFSDQRTSLSYGNWGSFGTGIYYATNPNDFASIDTSGQSDHSKNKKFYAIDLSKYNLYMAQTSEQAESLYNFLNKLQKFVLASSGYTKFDKELDGVNINTLYSEFQNVFKNISLPIASLENFINKMKTLVPAINQDKRTNSDAVNDVIDGMQMYLRQSDNIPTMFMKELGYQGIDVRGTSWDGFKHGSVVYDLDRGSPYIKSFETANELIEFCNNNLTQTNSIQDTINASVAQWQNGLETIKQTIESVSTAIQKSSSSMQSMADRLSEMVTNAQILKNNLDGINDTDAANTNRSTVPEKANVPSEASGRFTKSVPIDDTDSSMGIADETAQLNNLLLIINQVKEAIDAKTKAFKEEYVTVDAAVIAEIDALNKLKILLDDIKGSIQLIFSADVQKLGDINTKQNETSEKSAYGALQSISEVLGQIYGVLKGFTGIDAKTENSVDVKKPVDETRLNQDRFTEQDLPILNSILDAVNGINNYLVSSNSNSTFDGSDADNNIISNIYTLLSSRLSQNLASERTLNEAVSLINLLLDKSKVEKDLAAKATQYDNLQSFVRDNIPALKAIGVNNNESAMALWRNANYNRDDFQPIEMAMEDAADVIRNKVPESILDGWFRNADSGYKPKLENIALTDKDVRNAALNVMWDNYKQFSGKDIDFSKFLYSNIPVYRGKNQENYTDDDKVLSFTFDRSVAESFGKHILETVIRPIDTIGSYQTTAEGEVMVRKDYLDELPEFQTWLNNMSSGLKESFVQATSETSDIGSGSDYALEATLQSVKSVLESILNRMDVSEEQQIKPDAAVSEGSDNIIPDEQDGSGYALETTLQSVVTILNNILTGISISDELSAFTQPLSDAVAALKNVADGIIQHQKAQKSDTRVAQARIEDPAQQDVIRQKAIDTGLKLGSDVQIATLDSLTNGLVRVSGAFKNADGEWEGFTVKVNEANEAVDLAINKQSAFAKSLNKTSEQMADDSNPYIYSKDEVEARAQKHLNEYAAQGKKATVQFKDSGRYTITILEEIDGLSKQIFQTFDENDDKIERTTVTMSNSQKMKLDALQKKLIEDGVSSGLISDKNQIYVDYQKASDELSNMTDAYSKLDDVSDDQILKWKQQIVLVQQLGSQLTDLIKQNKLESDKKIFESDRSKKLSKFDLDNAKLQKDINIPDSFKSQIDEARKAIKIAADSDALKVAINNWETLKNKIKETAIAVKEASNNTNQVKSALDIAHEYYDGQNLSDKQKDFYSNKLVNKALDNAFGRNPSESNKFYFTGSKEDSNVWDDNYALTYYSAIDDILQLIGYHLSEIKPNMINKNNQWGFSAEVVANSENVVTNFEKAKEILFGISQRSTNTNNNFIKDLTSQTTSFDKYKNDIEGASGVTDELKTRLQELDDELKNVNDDAGLIAWQKKFNDLRADINVARDIFKKNQEQQSQRVRGELNSKLKEAGLNKSIRNPSADQQEILNKKDELIKQLNEYDSKVQYGQQAEISGIEQTKAALFGLIDAYKQKNNIVNANGNPSKQAYGTAQLLNQGAKYNSLVSRAQGVDLTGDFNAVKKLTDAYDKLKEAQSKFKIGEDLTTESGKAKVEAFKQAQIEFNRYAQELGKVVKQEEKLKQDQVYSSPVAENFQNELEQSRKSALEDFVSNIPDTAIGKFNKNLTELTYTVKNGDGTLTNMTATLNAAGTVIYATAGETEKATTAFGRFFDELHNKAKGIATYLISMTGFQEIWQQIRKGVQYVVEIDTALTELKKVTDETDATYDQFLQNMSKTAATVGSTVSELTTMSAEWARLGYSIEEAGKLAESTAILLNVSEFDNATEASKALISTMQAFSYTADESRHVVDILNEVGNNYAVSSDGLATALQDSASALMEGGNNLEQSVALIAAANKVVQDPNSVGSALRTISLRLRGTSTEV